MKKSLIALAVAGVFAAPAFAATGNVDIYGIMSFSVDVVDTNEIVGDSDDINTARDNASRFGLKGSEDVGGGMKGIYQVEIQLNADVMGGGIGAADSVRGSLGSSNFRNTFVGLSGGFGTVILGRHDTPYKMATGSLDPMADTVGDYNAIVGRTVAGNIFDLRAPQSVLYVSPDFGGFSGALAYFEAKLNEDLIPGVIVGGTDNTRAWSLMGKYANGPIFASLAYEQHEGSMGAGAVQSAAAPAPGTPADDISAWKVGLGYKFGDTQLGLVFEDISDGDVNGATAFGRPSEREAWYLSASHAMGPIKLSLAYGNADSSDAAATADDGADFWALGADYALSKRTSVYARYAQVENDGDMRAGGGGGYALNNYGNTVSAIGLLPRANDVDAFSVGIKHSF